MEDILGFYMIYKNRILLQKIVRQLKRISIYYDENNERGHC